MGGVPRDPHGLGIGLTARLLGVFVLVILAAAGTAWVVAGIVGPRVFHEHMIQAGVEAGDPATVHAEQAFRSANATALGVALAVAVVAALALSLLVTRRVSRSLGELSVAAERVAAGRFDSRVVDPHLGTEFAALAGAFNAMADDLADSQALRDRLLADVAHELRTPVATITAYLEAMEDGVAAVTPATMEVLRDQGKRLTRLAEDMVAVTRAEQGGTALHLEDTPVEALLAAALRAAAPAYRSKGVALETGPCVDAPVEVDRMRLAQVLANILGNALRHTPPGGRVVVSASRPFPPAVLIDVTDSGEGIAPEHLPHIFERFYRVDTARDRLHGGSGIGLAIAKAFVEAHGGRITARSEGPGTGTTITLALP